MRNYRLGLAVISGLIAMSAYAGSETDALKAKLESSSPGMHVKSIALSPLPGIYEVYASGRIFYSDSKGEHILAGNLYEVASKRNLTEERVNVLSTIEFDKLPFENAIAITKGSGARKFAVFSDPDCPYCKTLEQHLDKMGLENYTAYIFLYPLEEIHKDARAKSEAIWCATDRAAAWNAWMKEGKLPEKKSCENPVATNRQLGEMLGVGGTPTIYLDNGKKANTPDELFAALKAK